MDHFQSSWLKAQSLLKKNAPFELKEGQIFKAYDLLYVKGNYMFLGARSVNGRGFDCEENRPANLQRPLIGIL